MTIVNESLNIWKKHFFTKQHPYVFFNSLSPVYQYVNRHPNSSIIKTASPQQLEFLRNYEGIIDFTDVLTIFTSLGNAIANLGKVISQAFSFCT